MRRLRLLLLLLGGLFGLAACASTPPPPPELVQGDAWEYGLLPADLPAGWTFAQQAGLTAVDLARSEPVSDPVPLTESVPLAASLNDVTQMYTARYAPPETSLLGGLTLQILRYATSAEAQAGLSAEDPGEGWTKVEAETIGEQSQVWRYQPWITDTTQGFYRVDFRYWNAVGSVTMFGTAEAMPGPAEPLRFARLVAGRFKAGADPAALRALRAAGLPDPRGYLLNQDQLAKLDQAFGDRWVVSGQYLGTWTLNSDYGGEATTVLDRLGRVAGYQLYLVKPLTDVERGLTAGAVLFQQVSAYREAAAAPKGLQALRGLAASGGQELTSPPAVGEGRRAWSQVVLSEGTTLAIAEISFYLGRYVATVQVQSPPLAAGVDYTAKLKATEALAAQLAGQLAANLAAGQ